MVMGVRTLRAFAEEIPLSNEHVTYRCYGKPIPKTYDAINLLGRYKDPRSVTKGVTGILSAALAAGLVALQLLYIFN